MPAFLALYKQTNNIAKIAKIILIIVNMLGIDLALILPILEL